MRDEGRSGSFPSPVGSLSPGTRRADLTRLADEVIDVLVVGGGVTGAGIALDAVTRGLSVALVEGRDLASGTSSRSSKLIHGGLRYLEQRHFSLVREALRERHLLLGTLAPHLVRPVPFVYPLTHRAVERPYVGAGLALYDLLGGAGPMPRHRHLSQRRLRQVVPGLRDDVAVGGVRYFDAQVDDARFALTLARTAAAHGATVLTGTPVTALRRDADGRVRGALIHDTVTGGHHEVRARHVIGAVGVWSERLQQLAGVAPGAGLRVRASKGVHVTVPRSAIESTAGLITRTERSVLFVIPWGAHWLLGTTDTPWSYDLAHPTVTRGDVDFVLAHLNRWLRRPLDRGDVVSAIAGLRPLVDPGSGAGDTTTVSREHTIVTPAPGLTLIAGGKFTTYRVMAEDAVDVVASALGCDRRSCTAELPLLGAAPYPRTTAYRRALAQRWRTDPATAHHLAARFGTLGDEVLAVAADDPALARPLEHGAGYLVAEIVYAAAHEAVLHLDDVLTRRTRLSLETPDRGAAAAPEVAQLVGSVLGWDDRRRAAEVAAYRERLAAESLAEEAADDAAANAARTAWRDPRLVGLP